jgi:hypothetical protein
MMKLLPYWLDKSALFIRQRQLFCRFFFSSEAHSIKFATSTSEPSPFLSHLESKRLEALPKTALTPFRMNTFKSVQNK